MSTPKFYNEITLLKVFATFFITWFHLKSFAPSFLQPLFIGGMLGNSLFFFASGYLLKLKPERFKGEWLLTKLIRLFPSVWIATILTILLVRDVAWYNWLYPTAFWFVNAILCFFFIFYLLHDYITKYKVWTFVIVCCLHTIWYLSFVDHNKVTMDEGGTKIWFYCFLFFIYGYYKKATMIKQTGKAIHCVYASICIICFYAYKILCETYHALVFWQFIIQPLILFIFIDSMYYFALWLAQINISNKWKRLLSQISNMTLDIYVVQIPIMHFILSYNMPFPLNIIVTLIFICIVAFITNKLSLLASQIIYKLIKI